MRGVEGAGAYRTGHPLALNNGAPSKWFQIFFRPGLLGWQAGRRSLKGRTASPIGRGQDRRRSAVSRGQERQKQRPSHGHLERHGNSHGCPQPLSDGRTASDGAGEGAHDKENKEDEEQNLRDGGSKPRQGEKA